MIIPIYKIFKGWKSPTKGIKEMKNLPDNAKKYIYELEKFLEIPIKFENSYGANRNRWKGSFKDIKFDVKYSINCCGLYLNFNLSKKGTMLLRC